MKTTDINEQESRKKIEIDVPIGAEAIQKQEKRPRKMKRPTQKIKMEIENKTGQILKKNTRIEHRKEKEEKEEKIGQGMSTNGMAKRYLEQIPVFDEFFLNLEIGHSDFKFISETQNQGPQRFSF